MDFYCQNYHEDDAVVGKIDYVSMNKTYLVKVI